MAEPLRHLRPLGNGEVIDRAVTLFAKNFWKLTLISAIAVIPIGIINYYADPDSLIKTTENWINFLRIPAIDKVRQAAALAEMGRGKHPALAQITSAASILLALLGSSACALAAAKAYDGMAISIRNVYATAMRRWGPAVMTSLGFVLLFVVVYFAIIALDVVFTLVGIAIGMRALLLPIAFVALGVAAVATVPIFFMWLLAFVSVTTEGTTPLRAFRQAYRRLTARSTIGRSIGACFTVLFIGCAGVFITEMFGAIFGAVTHHDEVTNAVEALGTVVLNTLLVCYLVVYVFDLRIRIEGLDLQVAAQTEPNAIS